MRSLRTYAFAVLLAVGVIPLLVLALVMNANLRWNAVTAANDQLSMVINTSGERLAATMSAINHELAGLRYNPVLRNPGREQSVLQAELDRIRQSNGEYREISCYTADGQLVASSSLSPDLTTPEQDGETLRYLGETIGKGRPVISDPFQKAGHPGWSVSVY